MGEFAVPQREVRVRIQLEDGRELAGKVYVPEIGPDGEPGYLIDRLNRESEPFLALKEGQNIHLVHEKRILTVAVVDDEVEDRAEQRIEHSTGRRSLLVKIHLISGKDLLVRLSYLQPQDHERLQDYLNSHRSFIPVRDKSRLLYVNRDHVVSVVGLRGE